MKDNKFKAFACMELGLSTLILTNRITPLLNNLKKGNEPNEVSILSGTTSNPYFNFSKVDEHSGRTDLAVIPETSTNVSLIPGKIVKPEKFEADKFLTSEVNWGEHFSNLKRLTINSLSTCTFFDYSRYMLYFLLFNLITNLFTPHGYIITRCQYCDTLRPTALHKEWCRLRKRRLREGLIDNIKL